MTPRNEETWQELVVKACEHEGPGLLYISKNLVVAVARELEELRERVAARKKPDVSTTIAYDKAKEAKDHFWKIPHSHCDDNVVACLMAIVDCLEAGTVSAVLNEQRIDRIVPRQET
jgi:hypothetical protein